MKAIALKKNSLRGSELFRKGTKTELFWYRSRWKDGGVKRE